MTRVPKSSSHHHRLHPLIADDHDPEYTRNDLAAMAGQAADRLFTLINS